MAFCDKKLVYQKEFQMDDGSRLSIYQKFYKYSENEDEFKSMDYVGTKDHRMYLHNSSQPYDSEYDFEMLVDLWQMQYILELFEKTDKTYESTKELLKKMSEEVNGLTASQAGEWGNRRVLRGVRNTKLVKMYNVQIHQ